MLKTIIFHKGNLRMFDVTLLSSKTIENRILQYHFIISYQITCTGSSITSKSFLARAIIRTNKILTCRICVARFGNTFVNV